MSNANNMSKELEMLSKPRINRVVQAAKVEFELHGIMNSKIKDIAKRAEVGEASVYRYFSDKTELAKLVAFDYWRSKAPAFKKFVIERIQNARNGFEQVMIIFELFNDMYTSHLDILKFMEDYENYLVIVQPAEFRSSFIDFIDSLRTETYDLIGRGHADGTIDKNISGEEIYEFLVFIFLPTMQNLAIRTNNTDIHNKDNPERVMNNVKELFKLWITPKASE